MQMKNSYFKAMVILSLIYFTACGTDLLTEPAGTCVTCTNSGTVIEACADGDGNITVVTTDANGNVTSTVTSENTLNDFQVSQEGTGSSCN